MISQPGAAAVGEVVKGSDSRNIIYIYHHQETASPKKIFMLMHHLRQCYNYIVTAEAAAPGKIFYYCQ